MLNIKNNSSWFIKSIKNFDGDLYTHSVNTAELVGNVGIVLNFNLKYVNVLRSAGFLHDIGKTTWDKNLLTKVGWTANDISTMELHPVIGAKILNHSRYNSEVINLVKLHHCRPGGKGYPKNEPSYGALVLAACDVYDAMNSNRGYREKCSRELIFNELNKWAPKEVIGAVNRATRGIVVFFPGLDRSTCRLVKTNGGVATNI